MVKLWTFPKLERNIIMKKLIALFALAAFAFTAQAAEVSLKVDGLVCENDVSPEGRGDRGGRSTASRLGCSFTWC